MRKVWLGIKSIINLKHGNSFTPSHIISDKVAFTDSKGISNKFNEFFATIGKKVQNKVILPKTYVILSQYVLKTGD